MSGSAWRCPVCGAAVERGAEHGAGCAVVELVEAVVAGDVERAREAQREARRRAARREAA
jgi:hypothetical protein